MCITTNRPDTKANPNPSTKQHANINIQLQCRHMYDANGVSFFISNKQRDVITLYPGARFSENFMTNL